VKDSTFLVAMQLTFHWADNAERKEGLQGGLASLLRSWFVDHAITSNTRSVSRCQIESVAQSLTDPPILDSSGYTFAHGASYWGSDLCSGITPISATTRLVKLHSMLEMVVSLSPGEHLNHRAAGRASITRQK